MRISIHAPLAGRDKFWLAEVEGNGYFNPRAPRGARPQPLPPQPQKTNISIHAPLAGRDFFSGDLYAGETYFNPRAPRGARRNAAIDKVKEAIFQSTRPSRGATSVPRVLSCWPMISIHAPLAGRDFANAFMRFATSCISIHAPLAGRDR